jgi:hypothetical protein
MHKHRTYNAELQKQKQQWAKDVTEFFEQADGLLTVEIIRPPSPPRPELGIAIIKDITDAIIHFMTKADARPQPPLCLCCDSEFSPRQCPAAFLVVMPTNAGVTTVMVTGVCDACTQHDDEALKATVHRDMREFLEELFPDFCQLHAGPHLDGWRA